MGIPSRFYRTFDVITRSKTQREQNKRSFRWNLAVIVDDSSFKMEVAKVTLFLHPSFHPNDRVELLEEPFEFAATTYGEFPIRIRLHFRQKSMAPVDFYHHVRLDKGNFVERVHAVEMPIFDATEMHCPLPRMERKATSIGYSKVCKACGEVISGEHFCRFSKHSFGASTERIKRSSDVVNVRSKDSEYLVAILQQFITEMIELHMDGPQAVQTPLCIYDSIMSSTNRDFHSHLLALMLLHH